MKVFYTPKMVADTASYSPSAGKPQLVVDSWMAQGFTIELVEPRPVTLEQLYRAHEPTYVDDVLACRIANGFGNTSQAVANSLLYTSGSMLDAAHEAILSGSLTCAPVSGFHHACWDEGGGFCTFNGLLVTALDLLASGAAQKVGILDCDMHYGNGTDAIILNLDEAERIVHFTTGKSHHEPVSFLNTLADLIIKRYSDCDVLLYQAGADPHIDDPLGGWMTTAQLYARDSIVFETAKRMGLPTVFNLAGGYQRDAQGGISKVLEIHDNTLRAGLACC